MLASTLDGHVFVKPAEFGLVPKEKQQLRRQELREVAIVELACQAVVSDKDIARWNVLSQLLVAVGELFVEIVDSLVLAVELRRELYEQVGRGLQPQDGAHGTEDVSTVGLLAYAIRDDAAEVEPTPCSHPCPRDNFLKSRATAICPLLRIQRRPIEGCQIANRTLAPCHASGTSAATAASRLTGRQRNQRAVRILRLLRCLGRQTPSSEINFTKLQRP
mmetsp:Transcript_67917/g.183431  ORF Transcript_67917/g.183431 Transcript_67917/m.183431 type:complete len:219 (+) Transcript_67917:394-1050(+)